MGLGAARRGEAGQAAVEHIGLVLAIAVLLVATGAWLVSHARPGDPPTAVVDRVTAPLERAPTLPDLGIVPSRGHQPGLVRAIGGAVRAGRTGVAVVAVGTGAFGAGFAAELRSTASEFIRDPVGTLAGSGSVVRRAVTDPAGLGVAEARAAVAYARELRAMPPGAAYRRVMRDLGGVSADVAVTRGRQLVRRALLRAVRDRMAGRGAGRRPPRP